MSKATKRQKDKLQQLADKLMLLSSIDYFVGRERGMHKRVKYARPQIEKLLLNQRKQAVDAINKATSDIQNQYDKALNRRTKQITVATAATFLNTLSYDETKNLGLKQGILVCNRDTGMPMHVLPAQNALFSNKKTKRYFPENTFDEGKSERSIGNAFDGAYTHATNRLNKTKTQALYNDPHNRQFPIYRGTDNADVNDGSTGELEGVYGKTPVLLSRFSKLPIRGILQDMLDKMNFSSTIAPLPTLTFSNPDKILPILPRQMLTLSLGNGAETILICGGPGR